MVVFALFAGTIAFSGYRLYKAYKDVKEQERIEKEVAEETFISEAHKELAETERIRREKEELYREDLEEMLRQEEEELLREPELEDFYNEEGIDEEMEKLLYPPNSAEAKEQYVNMRLAEIDSNELRDILLRLFVDDIDLSVLSKHDQDLADTIMSEKAEFFGDDSIFVKVLWAGDLIMYFAYLAEFDLDEEVENWVQLFIDNLGITHDMSSISIGNVIGELVSHRRATKAGFGIFGLERRDLDDITEKNLETLGYNGVTFRSQYNKFLENVMEGY